MTVSLAQPNSRSALQCIAQKIFSAEAHAGHIRELAVVLAQITGVSAQDDPRSWESIVLDTGVAISPNQAARCLLEVLRSQKFMQGVAQAVEDKLAESGQVDILYAGTGPYGLLILPYLAVYRSSRIRVALLDIHAENIQAVNQLLGELHLHDMVECVVQADATCWEPPKSQAFDLIISETMNTLLRREPQVWIFTHLQQFLKPDGLLIPEKIHLRAWLTNAQQGTSKNSLNASRAKNPDVILGDLFVLDRESAARLHSGDESLLYGAIPLPDPCPFHDALKFTTDIQIYGDYRLTENESSLNMPLMKRDLTLVAGKKIQFQYKQSPHPEFIFDTPEAAPDDSLTGFDETGSLGVFHLKRIWKKSLLSRRQKMNKSIAAKEWLLDAMVYDELGVGLEPGVRAAFQCTTFAEFEQWILAENEGCVEPSLVARLNDNILTFFKSESVPAKPPNAQTYPLTPTHWDFWREYGYLVLPDVIPHALCRAACSAVYEFLDMNPENPDSWYQSDDLKHQIMVQLYRHATLRKIRECPAIHDVYRQLWQSDNLWMSTDRVSFNPPERPGWHFPGPNMHWDAELKAPFSFSTQGLVYLTDTQENQGAFTCVPGFHKEIDAWLSSFPPDTNPQQQNWQLWNTKSIAAPAGSLIVWHHALPHGSSPNTASSPRIVQYVNMRPYDVLT